MFDEFAQTVEFLPSTHIVTAILYKTMQYGYSLIQTRLLKIRESYARHN
jgi:hypothetical protein